MNWACRNLLESEGTKGRARPQSRTWMFRIGLGMCASATSQGRSRSNQSLKDWQDRGVLLENDIVMSSSLFMLITYYSVMTDTYERDWHFIIHISPILIRISVTDIIRSVTPLWYQFIPFFGDHYDIIFYSYQWCHILLSCTIYLQSSAISYHSVLILCYYCTICSHSFIMGSFLRLVCPLLIVSSTCTNNTLDVFIIFQNSPSTTLALQAQLCLNTYELWCVLV